tara:strand:- start:124 stop:531 length:408 start_codon:yes stop_codon:yes gene_type:complete
MKLLASAVFLVTLTMCTPAHGEDCKEVVPVEAPCRGILLPPGEAMEALLCLEVDLPREKALQLKVKSLCAVDIVFWKEKFAAEKSYAEDLEIRLEAALDLATEANPVSWYKHPALWFVGGAATAIGIAYAIKPAL